MAEADRGFLHSRVMTPPNRPFDCSSCILHRTLWSDSRDSELQPMIVWDFFFLGLEEEDPIEILRARLLVAKNDRLTFCAMITIGIFPINLSSHTGDIGISEITECYELDRFQALSFDDTALMRATARMLHDHPLVPGM